MWQWALAGALAGTASYLIERDKQEKAIKKQRGYAQDAFGYQQAYGDGMFGLQKGEALETLGVARNRLGEAFGADVAGFNLGLEGQALQTHAARASLADGAGMALAAQGASGTRGSDTLQRRIGFEEGMFGRQADLQQRGNSLAMQDMARRYTNQFADIGREADSWGAGGWRTQAKALGDGYADKMHGLQMKGYQDALDDIDFAKNPWGVTMDFLFAGLSGAGMGASFGNQVSGLQQQQQGGGGAAPPQYDYGLYGGNALGTAFSNFNAVYPSGSAPSYGLNTDFFSGPETYKGQPHAAGSQEWGNALGLQMDANNWYYHDLYGWVAGPGAKR